MDGRPVSLRIAGQSFKVVSNASDEELQRLARTISAKVEELGRSDAPSIGSGSAGSSTHGATSGGPSAHSTHSPASHVSARVVPEAGVSGQRSESNNKALSQAVLLAAISLAHELEEEKAKRVLVEQRARELLQRVLGQIDEAIDCAPEQ